MGKLERHLDADLVARIAFRDDGTCYIPRAAPTAAHKVKPPRGASTYRAARRNVEHAASIREAIYQARPLAPVYGARLNRSRHWPHARTYPEARANFIAALLAKAEQPHKAAA